MSDKISTLYRPYRPSNGTEGEIFMEQFCHRCAKYPDDPNDPNQCDILARSFFHQVGEPEYPKEWIEDGNLENPRCTAFEPK